MTATPTRAQLTPEEKARQRLVLRLAELGIPTADTDRQRHVCAVWTRGEARKRSEMTEAQADSLTKRLRKPDAAAALARALALPVPPLEQTDSVAGATPSATEEPAPEPVASPAIETATAALAEAAQAGIDLDAQTLPAGAIACGPAPLTEHDAEQVRRFAEFLETAGPPPALEHVTEEEPPAAVVEDQAAELEPAAPVVVLEPPCTTPEEIEAAAVAAVERHRARLAAGIVAEPPALGSIPPRVPLRLPPAADRYCLTGCYCRQCPQYPEQAEAAERVYRQELTAARNKDLRR